MVSIFEKEYNLRAPKLHDDYDIFSCGMVVDSVKYRNFIVNKTDGDYRKIGIIDMESYGFFSAIRAAKLTGAGTQAEGIIVRGISDYAGRKQQTEDIPVNWKDLSVKNAAIVAAEIILKHVEF